MTMNVDRELLTYIYASAQRDPKWRDHVRRRPNPASQTTSRNVTTENPEVRCSPLESYTGHTETESKTCNIPWSFHSEPCQAACKLSRLNENPIYWKLPQFLSTGTLYDMPDTDRALTRPDDGETNFMPAEHVTLSKMVATYSSCVPSIHVGFFRKSNRLHTWNM